VLHFEYDSKSRRTRKQVWSNATGTGTPDTDLKFSYDGWNLVAILHSDFSVLNSFMWGLDLSGSPQGAGGVGGLLEVVYHGTQTTNAFVAFDGNGNVAALVNAADGNTVARYEYGPFGEVIRATGPMARANPLRFSTKYQDDETDLLYYGYRYYRATIGSWMSRDRAASRWDLNLYAFTRNSPVNSVDYLGLDTLSTCKRLADAANSGNSTGNQQIDDLVKTINKNPICSFHISCQSKCSLPEGRGGECVPTTVIRKGDPTPLSVSSSITICTDRFLSDGAIAAAIVHELTHAKQQCGNKDCDSSCDACMACEIEAYKAQFPDLPPDQLQQKAKASCTSVPGDTKKHPCDGPSSPPTKRGSNCSSCN
jgi:RHS repeat-associated protein